jgi:hypothetical protein
MTCDLHEEESEGVETVKFGLDGYDYEIDLCAEHGEQVREQLQELISVARRAGGRGGRRSSPSRSRPERRKATSDSPALSDRERLQDIREWARSQGHDVKSRGRIPQAIVDDYEAAHGT